jgi:putative membrane protein
MKRLYEFLIVVAAGLLISTAWGASPVSTGEILARLHRANQREIDMGQMAVDHGRAKNVRAFGKTLVVDHVDADEKVTRLARQEGANLADSTGAAQDTDTLPSGSAFDAAFVKMMLDDHRRDISELEAARDATSDPKLKALIAELLPVLRKHERTAQRLVDKANRS